MFDDKELANRIFDLAFENDLNETLIKLNKIGLQARFEENVVVVDGAIRVGFSPSIDPVAKASQIAFAMCGILWTRMFPTLIGDVSKEWSRRVKTVL